MELINSDFPSIEKDYDYCRAFPNPSVPNLSVLSEPFRLVPSLSMSFRYVPNLSVRFRALPFRSKHFCYVPFGSHPLHLIPILSVLFRASTFGWMGFTLASCAEVCGFDPRLMQVVQSPSCELVQLRLEIHSTHSLARRTNPLQLV